MEVLLYWTGTGGSMWRFYCTGLVVVVLWILQIKYAIYIKSHTWPIVVEIGAQSSSPNIG